LHFERKQRCFAISSYFKLATCSILYTEFKYENLEEKIPLMKVSSAWERVRSCNSLRVFNNRVMKRKSGKKNRRNESIKTRRGLFETSVGIYQSARFQFQKTVFYNRRNDVTTET
jgi:hypothetical protein